MIKKVVKLNEIITVIVIAVVVGYVVHSNYSNYMLKGKITIAYSDARYITEEVAKYNEKNAGKYNEILNSDTLKDLLRERGETIYKPKHILSSIPYGFDKNYTVAQVKVAADKRKFINSKKLNNVSSLSKEQWTIVNNQVIIGK